MKVMDCHCHIFPGKIAEKASENVGDFYGVSPMYSYHPTGEQLLEDCASSPIARHIVHAVALKPSAVKAINDYIAQECQLHPEFVGFATMHPDFADPEAEIERALEMGLKGLKLHPDMQQVDADDPRLMKIYEIIEGRMPLMIHCGDRREEIQYSRADRLLSVTETFPNLVIDAAHLGGWGMQEDVCKVLAARGCFFDMSSCQPFMDREELVRIIRSYGTEHVMFGSDYPMWGPVQEYESFISCGFSDEELEDMLWNNCERYLGFEL